MVAAALAAALLAISAADAAALPGEGCPIALARAGTGTSRAISPEDLVALRDIGAEVDFADEPVFSVSPDGRRVAVQLRQADAAADRYCLAMLVIDLERRAAPRIVDTGGTAIPWRFAAIHGRADFPTGYPLPITPFWSADGQRIYFLKQTAGRVQVWGAAVDGTGAAQVTHAPADVARLGLRDGGALVYAARTGRAPAEAAIAAEGRRGFRYDTRFSPVASAVPFAPGPLPMGYFVLDPRNGATRAASAAERAWLEARPAARINDRADGLSTPVIDADRFPAEVTLAAHLSDGTTLTCRQAACRDPDPHFWWAPDRRSVLFQKRSGWAGEDTGFYRWNLATDTVRQLMVDRGRFSSCQAVGARLVCAYDASTQPRRIVALDPDRGAMTTLFDPNPDVAELTAGRVERLRWRHGGAEVLADLVHPVRREPGKPAPLVVVQYQTRGFLRGGTGDEYPIQAFAARGYYVLSMQSPRLPALARGARSYDDRDRVGLRGFLVRRLILGAIEAQVRRLIARGDVDAGRVGITGLSDGASTVQFAGLHSRLFRAAAMSSCCWEPVQDALLGPRIAEVYHRIGWPALARPDPSFWSTISWTQHPGRVAFPVLFQLADREYLMALPSFTALRQANRPAALYVYPDEHHSRWHPAHRLASYRRSLAWFDFWLRPEAVPRAEERDFVADWAEWRLERSTAVGAPAG